MSKAELLWIGIKNRSNGEECIPRNKIEDLLKIYPKDIWKELFDKKLIGYEDGFLYVDVSRETLNEPATVEEIEGNII